MARRLRMRCACDHTGQGPREGASPKCWRSAAAVPLRCRCCRRCTLPENAWPPSITQSPPPTAKGCAGVTSRASTSARHPNPPTFIPPTADAGGNDDEEEGDGAGEAEVAAAASGAARSTSSAMMQLAPSSSGSGARAGIVCVRACLWQRAAETWNARDLYFVSLLQRGTAAWETGQV